MPRKSAACTGSALQWWSFSDEREVGHAERGPRKCDARRAERSAAAGLAGGGGHCASECRLLPGYATSRGKAAIGAGHPHYGSGRSALYGGGRRRSHAPFRSPNRPPKPAPTSSESKSAQAGAGSPNPFPGPGKLLALPGGPPARRSRTRHVVTGPSGPARPRWARWRPASTCRGDSGRGGTCRGRPGLEVTRMRRPIRLLKCTHSS